jgi:glycosyltransferase involved in cell wall biosynthesis
MAELTVIVPTHDRRETVLLAIESARRQTRPFTQLIVVADGCTDGTAQAVRALGDPRVEVLELSKAAKYGWTNRNAAMERARGDVIAWLGDDDLWLPDHLERLGEPFDAGIADLATTSCAKVSEEDDLVAWGMDLRVAGYRTNLWGKRARPRMPSTTVAHRTRLAAAAGGWREVERRGGDLDLWRRMLDCGAATAWVAAPTALVFTALGRQQSWAERVAQNSRWAARLEDPAGLARVRSELALAVAELEWSGVMANDRRERVRQMASYRLRRAFGRR